MKRTSELEKSRRVRQSGETGQSVVFVALLIVALLGFLVLVVDVGYLYYTKRDLQGMVDAAAMAGAFKGPTGADDAATQLCKINEATYEALACYARNRGVNVSTVPSESCAGGVYYTFTPAWDGGSGTNYRYSAVVGGDVVTVTVFYQDAETLARDVPKELCVRVDAIRHTSLFFGGVLGFSTADVASAAAGYHGIFRITWTFRTGADVHASPTYYVDPHASGRQVVVVGSKDGYFYCLSALGYQDRHKKTWAYWRFRPNTSGGGTTTANPPEVTSTDDVELDPMILSSALTVDTATQVPPPVPAQCRSLVLFTTCGDSSHTGYLYALDAGSGSLVWSRNIQQPDYHVGSYGYTYIDSTPVLSTDKKTVYVGSRGGYLYAFNVNDGSLITSGGWGASSRITLAGGTICTPYVENTAQGDVIYIACSTQVDGKGSGKNPAGGSSRGLVYAFKADGTPKWYWTPSGSHEGFDSSPVMFGNTLYIGVEGTSNGVDTKFYALNKNTGAVNWSFTADSRISSTPAVESVGGNTYVYFASQNAQAYKLQDQGTQCAQMWQSGGVRLGSKDPSSTPTNLAVRHSKPALTEDYVYFGCQTREGSGPGGKGFFEARRKDNGALQQYYEMGADLHTNMQVVPDINWLFFAGCDNTVNGVDLNPGKQESKLLW